MPLLICVSERKSRLKFVCVCVFSHLCSLCSAPAGFWERQDGPQQQFQSLRQVHSSELPGEWHSERVRGQRAGASPQSGARSFNASVFFQSLRGEISPGEVQAGLPGAQREVREAGWIQTGGKCRIGEPVPFRGGCSSKWA